MGITRDYFAIQKHFEKKYGENTCVFIQIGKFYEVYEYDPNFSDIQIENENQGNVALKFSMKLSKQETNLQGQSVNISGGVETDEPIGHAIDMSLILHMKLTSKNKDKFHSMENPMLIGFPCSSYENHRDLILFHGFTIVRIDQKGENADSENVEREVVEISSPGTEIDNSIVQSTSTNTVVSIYIECQRTKKNVENNMLLCGLSCIDVSTGKNIISEVYSKENDEIYAIQEIYRFLTAQKPIEIILHVENIPDDQAEEYMAYLNSNLDLDHYAVKIIKYNQLDPNYSKDTYQEEILRKAFSELVSKDVPDFVPILQQGTSSIIYQLDLEKFIYGRISYMTLLQYCYEHNENIIKRLQKPQVSWTDESKHLILAHNAMLQLDIFSKHNTGYIIRKKQKVFDSLISVVDSTSTPIGARYLRRQLFNPITDATQLELIYGMTHELMIDEDLLNFVDCSLKKMPDLEKYQRKIQIGMIRPKEFVALFRGYILTQQIYATLFQKCFVDSGKTHLKHLFMSQDNVNDFNECLNEIWTVLNIDKLDKVKFTSRIGGKQQKIQCDDSFINTGNDPEIDQIQHHLQQYQNWLHTICEHLNSHLVGRVRKVEPVFERVKSTAKKEEDDEDEFNGEMSVCLFATSATAKQLRNAKTNVQLCGALAFHEINKTKTMINSEMIRQCCHGIETYQTMLEQRLLIKFYEIISRIAQRSYFSAINNFIGLLDFLKTNAQISLRYKYFRPQIDKNAKSPFIEVSNLRHPLIERIIRSEYITNTVQLGNEKNPNCILLFGVNSTGKSSLAKALGCIIMMAQAGLYIPGHLVYKPFSKIITRLSGEDNLVKGESSFVVEMAELRTILRGADQNTLVLGDELCRGTDTLSGAGLYSAALKILIDRNVKCIFSTHMHHLLKIPVVKDYRKQSKLKVSHLAAQYDETLDRLVYNRYLNDGPGSSQYGIEVCKSLSIDREFIDLANKIRRELDDIPNLFSNIKKSRYNPKIYVDSCELCKTKFTLQTHHIEEQNKADENGYIKHYHKNSSFNLLVLCQSCHQQLHKNGTKLIKKSTLEGVYLTPDTENEPIVSVANLGGIIGEKLTL